MILGFDDYRQQSQALAERLGWDCTIIESHRFPDGEIKLTLPPRLPGELVFCRSLDHPNEKLLELLLAAQTARELGGENLTLVAPYLCYMRQDKAFRPGEAVSQPIIGRFLAGLFDTLLTVDPHLHRVRTLAEAIPAKRAISLSATASMAEFLGRQLRSPFLLGPDSEARQWVAAVAAPSDWDFDVCEKQRSGDRAVTVTLPERELRGRAVVLVDDVASTGQTLRAATQQCLARGAASVDVLVTHALFADDAVQRLEQAGVRKLWSSDSITHASNVIPLNGLLAEALGGLC